jgi:hypothetical protein
VGLYLKKLNNYFKLPNIYTDDFFVYLAMMKNINLIKDVSNSVGDTTLSGELIVKRHHKMKCLIFFLGLLSFQSCGQKNSNLTDYNSFLKEKIEYKDSLLVIYIVKEWDNRNWLYSEDYSKTYKMTNEQVEYFIGGTFYSPDRKKIIIWVGEKLPNAETIENYSENSEINKMCPESGDTIYSLSAVVGFRDSINEIWKLYPLIKQTASCFDKKQETINILSEFYFKNIKEHHVFVAKANLDEYYGGEVRYDLEKKTIDLGYGHADSPLIFKNYGYNLQDKDFWDKCLLWQKGARVDGYYEFQLWGDKPLKVPEIEYPAEILKLYK